LLALKLIWVELDNEDDAYLVFETLNTRGKDLQVSHLVKNHLSRLMKVRNRALDPLRHNWSKILKTFETTQADLDVDSYLHHFWLSQSKEYVTAKKLFGSFKRAVTQVNAKATLDQMTKDAVLYRQIGEPTYGKWKREDKHIRASLYAISSVFRMRQPYPLLLSLMRCYRDGLLSKKNVEAALWVIECFHFEFTAIAQKSSSGGISFMYASWAQKLSNAKSPAGRQAILVEIKKSLRERVPSVDDFVAGFKELRYSDEFTRQKRLVQYVLARIEDHLSHGGVAVDFDNMTIEHVASQNPESGGVQIDRDHVAMLGNLLFCDEELQGVLGNKGFEHKKAHLRQSGLGAAKSVVRYAKWTNAEVEARTDELARLAYGEIWVF
jgi:hypothetical protein